MTDDDWKSLERQAGIALIVSVIAGSVGTLGIIFIVAHFVVKWW